jgi:hypothetical protein
MRSAPAYPKQHSLRAFSLKTAIGIRGWGRCFALVFVFWAHFRREALKTGLSAPIPQTLPQVKSVTYGNACGISTAIPCVEEFPASPEEEYFTSKSKKLKKEREIEGLLKTYLTYLTSRFIKFFMYPLLEGGDKTVRCTVLPPVLPYKEGQDRNVRQRSWRAQRNEDYGARGSRDKKFIINFKILTVYD